MIKEAKTIYPVHELISKRWSTRAFSDKPITETEVFTLVEAASWAPSSVNEQPWEYYYAFKGTEGFKKMLDVLSPGNQLWAGEAALMMVCIAHRNFEKNGQPNRHYMHDTGMANANLLTQALSMGIYGHILGGYDQAKATELFQIPDDKEAVCYIVLGYPGEGEKLEEPFRTREVTPRNRKPVEAIARAF